MLFHPFPVLETERLILRKMSPDDRDDFFVMRSDERMHTYTDTTPDRDASQTEEYLTRVIQGVDENHWLIWAIEQRVTRRVIGSIGIWNFNEDQTSAELRYGIATEFQGKGYMSEALVRVTEYAFATLQLAVLEAYTEAENTPSRRLLERIGFVVSGQVDDPSADDASVYHMIVYRLKCQTNQ